MFNIDKDNKILIIAIAVLIFLFLIGPKDSITGKVTLDDSVTSLMVYPKVVSNEEAVYITVKPGIDGVNQKVGFYKAEDNLRKVSNDLCNNYKCTEESSIGFFIPQHWESGIYYVKVYDYRTKNFIIEDFTVS